MLTGRKEAIKSLFRRRWPPCYEEPT